MFKAAKLVAFVATAKAAVAKKFYRDTLGLSLVEDTPFAIVFDANGITLRVQKVQQVASPQYTALGWEVADIQQTVKRLNDKQIRFERYPGMGQDEFGIWTSPSGAGGLVQRSGWKCPLADADARDRGKRATRRRQPSPRPSVSGRG